MEGQNIPTGFSFTRVSALVFAADIAAGEGPAKDPKRRVKMKEMVGNWFLRRRRRLRGDWEGWRKVYMWSGERSIVGCKCDYPRLAHLPEK
jgi:hypothetical protein